MTILVVTPYAGSEKLVAMTERMLEALKLGGSSPAS